MCRQNAKPGELALRCRSDGATFLIRPAADSKANRKRLGRALSWGSTWATCQRGLDAVANAGIATVSP